MRSQALLAELEWRGLLHQTTEHVQGALSAGTVIGYCGFDPTAPSLHVGNLVPVMGLVHLQRAGHRPIALVGGGTGLIGDPSGKSQERQLASAETVQRNAARIGAQLRQFLDFDAAQPARMLDNAEWLLELGAVDFMRDVGKHFTVNYMLHKESVQSRMETGISFTEFAYMLLQAYDFLELHRRHGVTLQIGGSDQWGNITAGIELIRRTTGGEAHGFTVPLLTTAAGTKFGKTEAGSVWLDPAMTSPYKFYQFWLNADDRDVPKLLRFFTLLEREVIEALDGALAERPEQREAQRALAADVTRRVHGADTLRTVEEVSGLLFGGTEPSSLSADAFAALGAEIPTFRVPSRPATAGEVLAALTTGPEPLFKSKGDARRMVQQGGVYVNGKRVGSEADAVEGSEFLHGRYLIVRKGARSYGLVVVEG